MDAASDLDDKISVALYVYGDRLDPDTVTQLMGIQPTGAHRKGDAHGPAHYHARRKTGHWGKIIDADGGKSEDALQELIAEVSPSVSRILAIPEVEAPTFDLFVARTIDADGRLDFELNLTAATLSAIAAAGLPLRVTLTGGPK